MTVEQTLQKMKELQVLLEQMQPLLLEIPKMSTLLASVVTSQQTIAEAMKSMANTNAVAEDRNAAAEKRYTKLEDKLEEANDRAAGKGQIPLTSHFLIVGSSVIITLLIVLYVHNQALEASPTGVKITKGAAQ